MRDPAFTTCRVTSPWGSDDDDGNAKKTKESLSEGEWSGVDGDDANKTKMIGSKDQPIDNARASKELEETELQAVEGPALPPSFQKKPKRKRRRSGKTGKSRTKKRKKSERKKSETEVEPMKMEAEDSQPAPEVERPLVEREVKESSSSLDNIGPARSKWDSTDEDHIPDAVIDEPPVDGSADDQTGAQQQIVSGVVGAEHLLQAKDQNTTSKRKRKKRKHAKHKKKRRSSSGSEHQNREADPDEIGTKAKSSTQRKASVSSTKNQKSRANRGASKASKGSSARLFEQARNVLLKAEAELAAMGYKSAKDALGGKLRRPRSYSSSRSRSSSRSERRGRRDSRSRRHSRSSSRSYSRTRHSSDTSSSSSRTGSRKTSRSGRTSKSDRSRRGRFSSPPSSRTSSTSSSSSKSPARSTRVQSHEVRSENSIGPSEPSPVVNIPRKVKVDVTGVVGTSAETLIPANKTGVKGESKPVGKKDKSDKPTGSSDDNDPYSEKSRRKNKMHKAIKELEAANPEKDFPVTAAGVRKAEKAKKQKKLKVEKLAWQPPLEYGEEENSENEEDIFGPVFKPKSKKKIKAVKSEKATEDVAGLSLAAEDLDILLSSGIENADGDRKISTDVLEKRAKHAKLFKRKLLEGTVNCGEKVAAQAKSAEGPVLPPGLDLISDEPATQDAVSGFGIMPKLSPKKSIKIKPPERKSVVLEKDLDSIWPEDAPSATQGKPSRSKISPVDRSRTNVRETPSQSTENVNGSTLTTALSKEMTNNDSRPFRAQQYNLAKEEIDSSESDLEWVPAKIPNSKKTITFNIKLPTPPKPEPKPDGIAKSSESQRTEEEVSKAKKKSKKRKKDKKKSEGSLSSLEAIAKTLKKHRERQKSEQKTEKKESGAAKGEKTEETTATTPASTSCTTTTQLATTNIVKPSSNNMITSDASVSYVNNHNATRPLYQAQNYQRMPYPVYPRHPRMRMSMQALPRGYPPPPFFAQSMMHSMGMRYPHMALPPMPPNMPLLPRLEDPPPLPSEEFPEQPPEPKQKVCKLSDNAVSDLFKKKIISAERLSSLLEEDESKNEARLPSPAPSLSKEKTRRRKRRSYRRGRSSSSDSSSYSRSSSRSRSSSYSDRSRSYSSYSSDYSSSSSESDRSHSRSSRRCRHRRRRSHSSRRSRRSYSSRSRSRSRRRSSRRTRSRSSDRYSSDSEYSSRSYSRSRSRSRRRSSYGSRRTRSR